MPQGRIIQTEAVGDSPRSVTERKNVMSPKKKTEGEQELSIEETFARLEEVLNKMEEGECSLEDSFRYYEEGMKLVKSCHDKIDRVEKRIQILGGEVEEE